MDPTPPRPDLSEPGSPTSNVLSLWEVPQLDLSVLLPVQPETPSSETPYPSFPLIPQNPPSATTPQSVFGRPLYLGSSSSATQPPQSSPPPPFIPSGGPTEEFSGYLWDYNIQFPNQVLQENAPPPGSFPHAVPTNFYGGFNGGVAQNDQMIHNGFVNVGDMGFRNLDVGMVNMEQNYNTFGVNQGAGGNENNNPSMVQGRPPTATLTCGCCIVLRRIIHSDGVATKSLEIHGGTGGQFHAACEVEYQFDGVPVTTNRLFDFSMQSFEMVKYFVVDYFNLQEKEETQRILQDSVSDLYTSLCANTNPNSNQMLNPVGTTQGMRASKQQGSGTFKFPKSNISLQRERTSNMKLEDIEDYMHLPIRKAALRVGVCPTVIKKICRRNGVRRWPHRKIKSIDRTISGMKQRLTTKKGLKNVEVAVAKIEKLTIQRAKYCKPDEPKQDNNDGSSGGNGGGSDNSANGNNKNAGSKKKKSNKK